MTAKSQKNQITNLSNKKTKKRVCRLKKISVQAVKKKNLLIKNFFHKFFFFFYLIVDRKKKNGRKKNAFNRCKNSITFETLFNN